MEQERAVLVEGPRRSIDEKFSNRKATVAEVKLARGERAHTCIFLELRNCVVVKRVLRIDIKTTSLVCKKYNSFLFPTKLSFPRDVFLSK